MLRRSLVIMAAAAVAVAMMAPAHAAKLGGLTSKKLFAMKQSGVDAVPDPLATENFNYGAATNLSGTSAETGQPWIILGAANALQQQGNQLTCPSACANGGYAAGIVDADRAAVTASVSMKLGQAGQVGLVMNADAGVTAAIGVLYTANTVQVARYSSTATTFSATQSTGNLGTTGTATLSASYAAGTYTIKVNGATKMTYALTGGDIALFGANTYFGVVMYGTTGAAQLDTFSVTK
jgi:hypothetical protein